MPGQARLGWLPVCLSLSLSLDQYVHSVLIKCHSPHNSSLCITLFSCAKFVSHKCCGKSSGVVAAGWWQRAGSRGSSVPEWQIAQLSHVFELSQPFNFNPSRINTSCCTLCFLSLSHSPFTPLTPTSHTASARNVVE